jgi:hypothetical protein
MKHLPASDGRERCCVCGVTDARALVDAPLGDGTRATLCGTHALMHGRSAAKAKSEAELYSLLRDRRSRRERRDEGDALGSALVAAFQAERRAADRRG